eukprot:TRINITY_DN79944_c0_g1_i1.p1 TRINITY_DN79944_c0_g1~~TRINITY_DN79944_c0_g1_i1.p1  ORF type:complete len:180 (-),score=50.88 TRINITY_DN79944_c0_g1_i1:28-567(-)
MGKNRKVGTTLNKNRRKTLRRKHQAKFNFGGNMSLTTSVPFLTINWEKGCSFQANFRRLGLEMNPNKQYTRDVLIEQSRSLGFKQEAALNLLHGEKKEPVRGELADELEKIKQIKVLPHKQTSLPPWEIPELKKLIAKYGDDYGAMAKDITLNRYQKTAAQLEKRIEIFHELYGDKKQQ